MKMIRKNIGLGQHPQHQLGQTNVEQNGKWSGTLIAHTKATLLPSFNFKSSIFIMLFVATACMLLWQVSFVTPIVLVTRMHGSEDSGDMKRELLTPAKTTSLEIDEENELDFAGTFNGFNLHRRKVHPGQNEYQSNNGNPTSTVHCVGTSYGKDGNSWVHRSCSFTNLCFDVTQKDYVIFPSQASYNLIHKLQQHQNGVDEMGNFLEGTTLSSAHANDTFLSLGSINLRWPKEDIQALKWFPHTIVPSDNKAVNVSSTNIDAKNVRKVAERGDLIDYNTNGTFEPAQSQSSPQYEVYWLPDNAILIPWHSMSGSNVGHLLWDDFLPIYTLASMFHLIEENHHDEGSSKKQDSEFVLMRYVLKNRERGLWPSCDWTLDKASKCSIAFQRWLPAIGSAYDKFSTTEDFRFNITNDFSGAATTTLGKDKDNETIPKSPLVCARNGLAGMGILSDHGLKKHGWEAEDYEYMHNHGRGPELYRFRNFMLGNVLRNCKKGKGGENGTLSTFAPFSWDLDSQSFERRPFFRIIFSTFSSNSNRGMSFDRQISATRSAFQNDTSVAVESYTLANYSIEEQIGLISNASILISACGGGAVTSLFLSKGSSLLLYHDATYNSPFGAKLDWDILNNMSYLRVHWLPLEGMDENRNVGFLVDLIKHDLNVIKELRVQVSEK